MGYGGLAHTFITGMYRTLVSLLLSLAGLGIVKDSSIRYWDGTHFRTLYLPRERRSVVVVEMVDVDSDLNYAEDLRREVVNWNLGVPMTVSRAVEALKIDPTPKELRLIVLRDGKLVNFTSQAPHASPL